MQWRKRMAAAVLALALTVSNLGAVTAGAEEIVQGAPAISSTGETSPVEEALSENMLGQAEAVDTAPSEAPAGQSTDAPTAEPADAPTAEPADAPTAEPADAPTAEPADAPTAEPADAPTAEPADAPTEEPALYAALALQGEETVFCPGDTVVWVLTISHDGTAARTVQLASDLAGAVFAVPESGQEDAAMAVAVPAGAGLVLEVRYTVPEDALPGTLVHTVTVADPAAAAQPLVLTDASAAVAAPEEAGIMPLSLDDDGADEYEHGPVTVTSPNFPNEYTDDLKKEDTFRRIRIIGAEKLLVYFDPVSELEWNYDFIYVQQPGESDYILNTKEDKQDGANVRGRLYEVYGDTVDIWMTTDGSVTKSGFSAQVMVAQKCSYQFVSEGVKLKAETVHTADVITAPDPGEREGYVFAGWYDQSGTPFMGRIFTDGMVYTARWRPIGTSAKFHHMTTRDELQAGKHYIIVYPEAEDDLGPALRSALVAATEGSYRDTVYYPVDGSDTIYASLSDAFVMTLTFNSSGKGRLQSPNVGNLYLKMGTNSTNLTPMFDTKSSGLTFGQRDDRWYVEASNRYLRYSNSRRCFYATYEGSDEDSAQEPDYFEIWTDADAADGGTVVQPGGKSDYNRTYQRSSGDAPVTVTSPNYPSEYPNDLGIGKANGTAINRIQFTGASRLYVRFDTGNSLESGYDYVSVGVPGGEPQLETSDSSDLNGQFLEIEGDTVLIELTTDGSVTNRGYSAEVGVLGEGGSFTCTFIVDGETRETRTVEKGGTLSDSDLPDPPTKDGAVFMGWYSDSGIPYISGCHVYNNITYTARWFTTAGAQAFRPVESTDDLVPGNRYIITADGSQSGGGAKFLATLAPNEGANWFEPVAQPDGDGLLWAPQTANYVLELTERVAGKDNTYKLRSVDNTNKFKLKLGKDKDNLGPVFDTAGGNIIITQNEDDDYQWYLNNSKRYLRYDPELCQFRVTYKTCDEYFRIWTDYNVEVDDDRNYSQDYEYGREAPPVTVTSPRWPRNYPNNLAAPAEGVEGEAVNHIQFTGAKRLYVHFSEDCDLEWYYDFLHVVGGDGTVYLDTSDPRSNEGGRVKGQDLIIEGDSVDIWMSSDVSVTRKGYSVEVGVLSDSDTCTYRFVVDGKERKSGAVDLNAPLPDDALPETPTKEGYVFTGWYDNYGNPYRAGRILPNNVTYTAAWQPVGTVPFHRLQSAAELMNGYHYIIACPTPEDYAGADGVYATLGTAGTANYRTAVAPPQEDLMADLAWDDVFVSSNLIVVDDSTVNGKFKLASDGKTALKLGTDKENLEPMFNLTGGGTIQVHQTEDGLWQFDNKKRYLRYDPDSATFYVERNNPQDFELWTDAPIPDDSTAYSIVYHDAAGNPQEPVDAARFQTLRTLSDVEHGGESYSFVGWSTDETRRGNAFLTRGDSANLYDYDYGTGSGTLKEAVRAAYSLQGTCNPDVDERVNLNALPCDAEGNIHLYPVYAVHGDNSVVTANEDATAIIGLSGWRSAASENEKWLGSVNIEVYKDGEPWVRSTPMYFSYHNDNSVDVIIKFIEDSATDDLFTFMTGSDYPAYDPTGHYVIDAVYAEQGGGESGGLVYAQNWMDTNGGRLDNVAGGSTIKVYVTSKFNLRYYLDNTLIEADGWNNDGYYTTVETEQAFDAATADAQYHIDETADPALRGLMEKDTATVGGQTAFLDGGHIQRGEFYGITYQIRDYAHVATLAGTPDEDLLGPDRALARDSWYLKGADGTLRPLDWGADFAISNANKFFAYKDEDDDPDSPYTYHLYAYSTGSPTEELPPVASAPGNLTVSKKVTAAEGLAVDAGKAFPFTVTLNDTDFQGTYGGMDFVDGIAGFALKDGEAITAEGLPEGLAYKVEEQDNAGYTVTVAQENAQGTIRPDETVTVAFTNHLESTTGPDTPEPGPGTEGGTEPTPPPGPGTEGGTEPTPTPAPGSEGGTEPTPTPAPGSEGGTEPTPTPAPGTTGGTEPTPTPAPGSEGGTEPTPAPAPGTEDGTEPTTPPAPTPGSSGPSQPTPTVPAVPSRPVPPVPPTGPTGPGTTVPDGSDTPDVPAVPPADIPQGDTPLAGTPDSGAGGEASIAENGTPLAGGALGRNCCILHLIIMLVALAVALYYTHNRKSHQKDQFDMRYTIAFGGDDPAAQ